MRAKLFGDLDGRRTHAARAAHHENPIACSNLRAIREHVHGSAARQCERGRGIKFKPSRNLHQRASGNDDEFRKAAIARDAEKFATQTNRLLTAFAEFTLTAEKIGLHGHSIADFPICDCAAELLDASGDLTAGRARERNLNRQASGFEPEIEMIQSAREDTDDARIR